jgi:hypothetical protein
MDLNGAASPANAQSALYKSAASQNTARSSGTIGSSITAQSAYYTDGEAQDLEGSAQSGFYDSSMSYGGGPPTGPLFEAISGIHLSASDAQGVSSPSGIDQEPNGAQNPSRNRDAPAPQMQRGERIVTIDDRLSVETDSDKYQSDLIDLVESQKGRKPLTGFIHGIERENNISFAVIYHGDFKVIIPAEEAVELPDDLRGRSPSESYSYLLNKRLGAEIDYIVKGVDASTQENRTHLFPCL